MVLSMVEFNVVETSTEERLDARKKMGDGITVISQSTAEQREEMLSLFEQVEPDLKRGLNLAKAIRKVKPDLTSNFYGLKWYKDLRDYVELKGYRGRY